jgi:ribonuclease R
MGRKHTHRKKQKSRKHADQSVKGVLEITRSGVGFVMVPEMETDVLIKPGDFHTALHGDTVRVKIKAGNGRRMQGEVEKIVQRKRIEFTGRIEMKEKFGFFLPQSEKPMPDLYIPLDGLHGAKDGDKVVVRMVSWDQEAKKPVGEVVEVLSPDRIHDLAMKEIILEEGFPLNFSDEAIEISQRIPEIISHEEIKRRKDFRSILTFTIDPPDAKDFDDAISFQQMKNGYCEVGVHIADVSHYLEPGAKLDEEAYQRATSVYLPDRVNPMLPEHISNFLCSLRPGEDKLCFAVIFQMNEKGEIKKFTIEKTIIHSQHRFTYDDVQQIIDDKKGIHAETILFLNDMTQRVRKKRFQHGAINFSSEEVKFRLNEKGEPLGITVKENKEAHQLIEELMLLANRKVAETISKIKFDNKSLPFPYRVHDDPDQEKLIPFVAFAKKFGHKFDMSNPGKIAESFNQLLKDVHGKPEQHVLEQLGIRTMAKAKYTIENVGHYGLGFEHYCHFTSPIRRYPDILVHRILQETIVNKIKPDKKLEEKCRHCSERERAAMDAERAANKYLQVLYMKNFLGEEFEGIISGVASFGFWVETIEHKCEGLISLNSLLEYDEFRHDESDYSLIGRRSGKKFRMGDKVLIRVVSANLSRRQLDYEWVVGIGDFQDKGKKALKSKKEK